MWSTDADAKHELKDHEVAMGRTSGSSEVVIIDDRVMEGMAREQAGNTNITISKSSRLHIGPKFVSVTQNIDNTEKVKDLPLTRYLWDLVKSTTKAERLSCGGATILLLVCISLIVYFTVIAKKTNKIVDVAPHKWYITRNMWLAPDFDDNDKTEQFEPLRLVIIAHTAGPECNLFSNCAGELQTLQRYYKKEYGYDLPYNFLIGNEGRVYEGRGFQRVGAHTRGYNRCSLGIAFTGDYREGLPSYSKITALQLERARMLLSKGIKLGYLHPNLIVLGAKDVDDDTLSPGSNIYNEIRKWPNYIQHNIRNRTCEEIYEIFNSYESDVVVATPVPISIEDSKNVSQLIN